MDFYDAVEDPYCYPATTVLRNLADIRDQAELDAFEAAITKQRADEPLPPGQLSVTQYKAVHHHLFQDVFEWAGKYRNVRVSKDGSAFCYPENIEREMRRLFQWLRSRRRLGHLSEEQFAAGAAHFLSELNAIHPFREGNGRTQTTFLAVLAEQAGHPLHLERLSPNDFLDAMLASFKGNQKPLERQILSLI